MSLLTRCPACTTLYRVVPDQLRISDGWVKCGQCSEIFDASKHLMDTGDLMPPTTATEQIPDEPQASSQPLPAANQWAVDETPTTLEPEESAVPAQVDPPLVASEVAEVTDDAVVASNSNALQDTLPDDTAASPRVRWDDTPKTLNVTQEPIPTVERKDPVPSFLIQASTRSPWKKPLTRAALLLAAVLLCLTLFGQWLYVEKDRLAAQYPEMKMTLDQFCTLSNCTVMPFRQIESLSVDSVGFTQLGKETYRLNFVVKNASALPLSMPAVELSLTDAQDQPAYRRVFNSTELGSNNQVISAGAEWAASAVLKVNSETTEKPVRGYRLLIFYP